MDEIIDKTMFLFLICIRMPYKKMLKFDKINVQKGKHHISDKKKYFLTRLLVLEIMMMKQCILFLNYQG